MANAAHKAAKRLLRDFNEVEQLQVSVKGPSDFVSQADLRAEQTLREELDKARPGYAFLMEEAGAAGSEKWAWRWVIDPLDGTVNYAHGYPCFCVSIGVEHHGVRTVGVVYDPLRDECFDAVRGSGARRNGRAIRVSEAKAVATALLATGFAYDVRDSARDNLAEFARAAKAAGGVRRDGSAALDLCYVACGRFDGYWELKLHPWDVAAGILIVEEAGGRVTDLAGGPVPATGHEIVSSNGAIHDELLHLLAGGA